MIRCSMYSGVLVMLEALSCDISRTYHSQNEASQRRHHIRSNQHKNSTIGFCQVCVGWVACQNSSDNFGDEFYCFLSYIFKLYNKFVLSGKKFKIIIPTISSIEIGGTL